jgi:hypothetical protein
MKPVVPIEALIVEKEDNENLRSQFATSRSGQKEAELFSLKG